MDKVAQYFSGLGNGSGITSLDVFKGHVATVIKHYPPVNMMRQFWLASRAASRIPNLNPAASARVTRDANNFFHQEVQRLETVIDDPSVTIQDLERVLNTYARLQTVPPSSMLNKLILKTAEKMPDADAECLARLPAQFVELGIYPSDEWMDTWWNTARPQSGKWDRADGYAVLYRLALLDFLRESDPQTDKDVPSPCRKIAEGFFGFIEKFAGNLFPDQLDSRVFFAAKWFGKDFIDRFKIEAETSRSSRAEDIFAQAFTDTNIIVRPEGIIVPQTGHKIDFELIREKSFGAEYDGVGHFNRVAMDNPSEQVVAFNTSTRFQSWLMTELSPELHVLRVPYFYCDGSERNQPWEDTLEALDSEPTGVYAYHGDGDVRSIADKHGYLYEGQPL